MGFEFRWIMGSISAVILFGVGLLVYGVIISNTSPGGSKETIDAGKGALIKVDKWECVLKLDARGNPYQIARNARNGATGPPSLGCKKEP